MSDKKRANAPGNISSSNPQSPASSLKNFEFLTTSRALFIIIAATVLVYANSLSGQFVFDDTKQILGNPSIHSWASFLHAFTRDVWDFQRSTFTRDIAPPYYRPFFTIYLTVGYHLFGIWEPGWHLLNLAIHASVTLLVFFLVRRLSREMLVATVSALIFGLLPAHVESVSWISGIPDPLSALFFIPALIWYVNYRESGRSPWLVLSLASFFLATLCKETALSLPMIIFVLEFTQTSGGMNARITRATKVILPYASIGLLYLVVRYEVLGRLSWNHPMTASVSDSSIIMTIPYVVVSYIRHTIAPYRLSLIYRDPFVSNVSDPRFLISAGILIAACVALLIYRKMIPSKVWIGLTMFVAPLLPVLNIRVFHMEYVIQDRYMYLPSIGVCLLLGLLIAQLSKSGPTVVLIVAAFVIGGFGVTTVFQNRVWHDSISLWQRAVEHSPNSASTHYNLGLALLDGKQYEAARAELLKSVELNPSDPLTHNNLALTKANLNDLDGAVQSAEQALALGPRLAEAHNNLGTFLYTKGDYQTASAEFKKALDLDPTLLSARFNLARSLSEMGDHVAAIQNFEAVITQEPNDAPAHYQFGLSLAAINRKSEAINQIETAISLEQNFHQAEAMRSKLEDIRR